MVDFSEEKFFHIACPQLPHTRFRAPHTWKYRLVLPALARDPRKLVVKSRTASMMRRVLAAPAGFAAGAALLLSLSCIMDDADAFSPTLGVHGGFTARRAGVPSLRVASQAGPARLGLQKRQRRHPGGAVMMADEVDTLSLKLEEQTAGFSARGESRSALLVFRRIFLTRLSSRGPAGCETRPIRRRMRVKRKRFSARASGKASARFVPASWSWRPGPKLRHLASVACLAALGAPH